MSERSIRGAVAIGVSAAAGSKALTGGGEMAAEVFTTGLDGRVWVGGALGFVAPHGQGSMTGEAGFLFGSVTPEPNPLAPPVAVALGSRRICAATQEVILVNIPLPTVQANTEKSSFSLTPAVGMVSDRIPGIEGRPQIGALVHYARFLDEERRALLEVRAQVSGTTGGEPNQRHPDETTVRLSEGWGVYADAGIALAYRLGNTFSVKIEAEAQDNWVPYSVWELASGDRIANTSQHNWGVTGTASAMLVF